MAGRVKAKTIAVALVLTAGIAAFGPPAGAIQTTTWGIYPSSHGGPGRGSFSYPSNGQTVHDSVIVYNRTNQPEVINLSVLDATDVDGRFQYSNQRTGFASGIALAADRIPLGPNQQAEVPVTVRLPRQSKVTTVAAVAAESAPAKRGALFIQERLVILVKATPSTHPAPLVPDLALWGPIAGGVLALAAGLLTWEARKRRPRTPVDPAETAETAHPHAMALR
jgi:hypothetical protein